MSTEAEREVADLEQHAQFEMRMGVPESLALAPMRERLVDALDEQYRLRDEVHELKEDLHYAKQEEEYEEVRANELSRDLDQERDAHEATKKDFASYRLATPEASCA